MQTQLINSAHGDERSIRLSSSKREKSLRKHNMVENNDMPRRFMILSIFVLLNQIVNVTCLSIKSSFRTPSRLQKSTAVIRRKSNLVMYLPSSSPTSETPGMVAKRILSDKRDIQSSTFKPHRKRPLANSVLASSDVLPTFRAAHGLLHPQTVLLLEETTVAKRSLAVSYFLDTYWEYGPMACLPVLSDPEVLPELTKALRGLCSM